MIQKKAPGQLDESTMASTIVIMKMTTIARMLHTMRVVRSPLEIFVAKFNI